MSQQQPSSQADTPSGGSRRLRIVVATSVMLSFISFWRAAAIVLNDLASTAYYIGGITEHAVGKAAPWFVLGVMLFASAVRAVYVESCAMFVRGGVYRVVKEAMGGTLAKLSVSALIFDYILTGPISGVSAGQYIAGLINESARHFGLVSAQSNLLPPNLTAVLIAIAIVGYFWRLNVIGLHESSERALRIMQITGVMVVLIIIWCGITLLMRPAPLPPFPIPTSNLNFSTEALGWLKDTSLPSIGLIGLMIAFGHSVLAMSGEESLAQVSRELEHPKIKNLKRAAMVIFVFTISFTPVVSFFAVMIIPDAVRDSYKDNLLSGLAMNVVGPEPLKLLFQAFVVIVGFMILAGAVNTSLVGSNGVLNRVSEDGVLTDWFRAPQKRYGTSYRIINMVALLQIAIIIISQGNVILLGEAYAFGVIWSFTFMSSAIVLLRFKRPGPREWRVPLNPRIGGVEIPVGLLSVALILLSLALTNLLTKQTATISGVIFTASFFIMFLLSERAAARRRLDTSDLDKFNLVPGQNVTTELVRVRPGGILVTARDYNSLHYLKKALEDVNTEEQDVTVMTVRVLKGPSAGEEQIYEDTLFTDYEQLLFTRAVAVAEKLGKKIHLLVVPSNEAFQATVMTAVQLECSMLVAGVSTKMTPDQQAKRIGDVWETIQDERKRKLRLLKLIHPDGTERVYELGAHRPNITPEDIELTHRLWLDLARENEHLHHNQIVSVALRRLAKDLAGKGRAEVIAQLKKLK
jgi:amino acid transporter